MQTTKSRSWFRHSDALIAAFTVPVIIMIIIFVQRGIFPFGENSFLRTDMYHQYAPFFSELQNKLKTGGNLLFSWNLGLGINFTSLYAYYLASPLNWLLAIVPQEYIIEFMTYLVVLKTGLAGLTMTIYLNANARKTTFATALFGIFYALSGYMVAYNWNIMWLDCVALFPLIALGVEKIVEKKSGLLYAFSLGLCILSNYYISMMICAFLVVWFFMTVIVRGEKSFGSFCASAGIFAGYSLLAGAIAAVMILPAVYTLQSTASANSTFPTTVSQYFSIIDMVARHMVNVQTEQVLDHWPNIYCGVGVYLTLILYVLNRKISLKEKSTYLTVVLFFLISFSLNILNYIWHGLHYPNSLPSRQSFLYIFLLLVMSFRAVEEWDGNTRKDLGIAFLGAAGFILLCQKVVTDDAFVWSTFYISLGFVAIYGLLLYLYRSGKMTVNMLLFLLLAVVAVEAAVNTTTTGVPTSSRTAYMADADARVVLDSVADDPELFRVNQEGSKTKNDDAWLNYHGTSLFSSTARQSLSTFYRQMGCESSVNSYSINGSTPLIDMLFGVKYTLTKNRSDNDVRDLYSGWNDFYLYQNKYYLPIAYMIPADLETNWTLDQGDPIAVQNDFGELLGAGPLLEPVDGFTRSSGFSVTTPEDGSYYAFSENGYTDKVDVTIGDRTKTFENVKRRYLLSVGYLKKNDIVDMMPADETENSLKLYRFRQDNLATLFEKLAVHPLIVEQYDDTHICGSVNVDKRGVLLTTIPFDKGWTVKVDGTERSPRIVFDAFVGVDLEEGLHRVELEYNPEGFGLGLLISMAAILILLLICCIKIVVYIIRKILKHNEEKKQSRLDSAAGAAGSDAPDSDSVSAVQEDAVAGPDGKPGGPDLPDSGSAGDADNAGDRSDEEHKN